jgi:xylulokinase
MSYIASFDIGTTQAKGILVEKDAKPQFEKDIAIHTDHRNGVMEQNAEHWYQAVIKILSYWFDQGVQSEDIQLVTFSGQMQDCIPVNKQGKALRPAILYGDGRAGKQADLIEENFPIQAITGNHMDGTILFPKLLWLKEQEIDVYQRTSCFLMGSKDYVIHQLTGENVIDPTTAATTGMMNAQTKQWEKEWLLSCGLDPDKLPAIRSSNEIVGGVTEAASKATGLVQGTPVLCGIGDGGSASVGAGVFQAGEVYGYIGTTGWMATPVNQMVQGVKGIFHLPYMENNQFLAIAPLMNAGNVHKWAMNSFSNSYEEFEQLIANSDRSHNNLLFLPYLNGERFPVQDANASGCMIGIRPDTTSADMGCAVLEGVAMAMRQVMEVITDEGEGAITLIGGGTKSKVWNQIMTDVLNREVRVPGESQFFPAMGAVVLGAKVLGWANHYTEFAKRTAALSSSDRYVPSRNMVEHYNVKYRKYKKLYEQLKDIF